jgi:pimeloyl-ACP methyl ester carboxylesterase
MMGTIIPFFLLFVMQIALPQTPVRVAPSDYKVLRHDFSVRSDSGIELFVREVRTDVGGPPVLLIHGGGPGGLATFDLEVPGYSMASNIAATGYDVYVMDLRGFGRSSRPAFLHLSNASALPAVTTDMAVRDIAAVVRWIRRRAHGVKVTVIGHASGGHWGGMYTSHNNDSVSHLVLINSMHGVRAPWSLAQAFEDPQRPGTFDPHAGPCRLADAAGLLVGWNRSIPGEDKSLWRDPRSEPRQLR